MRAWRKLRHRLLTLKQEVSLKQQEKCTESSACLGSLHTNRPRPILSTPEAFLSKTNRRSRESPGLGDNIFKIKKFTNMNYYSTVLFF